MRALPLLPLLSLLAASVARAQSPRFARGDVAPVGGLRVGVPLGASLYVGPAFVTQADPRWHEAHGITVLAEPGLGGGQIGLGYANLHPLGGYRAQALVLRTWGRPRGGLEAGQTFVGAEVHVRFGFGLAFAAYQRLSPPAPGPARRLALSATWGII